MESLFSKYVNLMTLIGTVLTIVSLVYAFMTNREKARREKLVKHKLAGIAGNITKIRPNPAYADQQFRNIRDHALKLDRNEDVELVLKYAHDGSRDVTAAERMLGNLLNEVMSLQQGLFDTDIISHIDDGIVHKSKKSFLAKLLTIVRK